LNKLLALVRYCHQGKNLEKKKSSSGAIGVDSSRALYFSLGLVIEYNTQVWLVLEIWM
jgi:hypothetical protein